MHSGYATFTEEQIRHWLDICLKAETSEYTNSWQRTFAIFCSAKLQDEGTRGVWTTGQLDNMQRLEWDVNGRPAGFTPIDQVVRNNVGRPKGGKGSVSGRIGTSKYH